MSLRPFFTARWSGVEPSGSGASALAPLARSMFAISTFPPWAALWKGVRPDSSFDSTGTPLFRANETAPVTLRYAARWSGYFSRRSLSLRASARGQSFSASPTKPFPSGNVSGVSLYLFRTLSLAPCASSHSMTSSRPAWVT